MQVVNGFWDMLRQYTDQNILYIFIALAWILFLYELNKEERRITLTGFFLLLAAVFNPISYKILTAFTGQVKTYYRFFWLVPCEIAIAFLLYHSFWNIKNMKHRLGLAIAICVGIICIRTSWDEWKLPENSYQFPYEILEVAQSLQDLKDEAGQDKITILADQSIFHIIRQYDATICFPFDRYNAEKMIKEKTENAQGLMAMLSANQDYLAPDVIREILESNEIDYLVMSINNDISLTYMQRLHWQIVATTSTYHILQYQEPVFHTEPFTDAGIEIEPVEVTIPGLTEEYHFLYLANLHIITENDEISPAELENIRSRQRWSSVSKDVTAADYWGSLPDILDSCNADAVLLGGDMIDFCSTSNINCLKRGLDRLVTPYLYVRADHDSKPFWCEGISAEECTSLQNAVDGNMEVWCMELSELCVAGLSNSTGQISVSGLAQMKEIFAKEKPILLLTHVPYDSLADSSLQETSRAVWQNLALVWGKDGNYQPDENTKELMEMIYANDSPVKEILCGHLHFTWDGQITENTHEHVFSPAFENKIGVITVKGSP